MNLNSQFLLIFVIFSMAILLIQVFSEGYSTDSGPEQEPLCNTPECGDVASSICFTRGYGKCHYLNTGFTCKANSIYFQNCQGKFLAADPSIKGGTVHFVDKPDESCCFEIGAPLYDIRLTKAHSIQSVKFPGHYLRHQGRVLKLQLPIPENRPYHSKLDYLFRLSIPPHEVNRKTVAYLLPVQASFRGSCFYSDGETVRFRPGDCHPNDFFKQNATFYVGPITNLQPFLCGKTEDCLKACPMTESCFSCPTGGLHFRNCQGLFLSASPYQHDRIATFTNQPDLSCCFKITKPPHKEVQQDSGHAYSIESVAYPGNFLRHSNYVLRLDTPDHHSHSDHLKQDFAFNFAQGRNGDPDSMTLMPIQEGFRNSCFYTDKDNHLRFKPGHCSSNQEFKNQTTLYTCPKNAISRYFCGTTQQCSFPFLTSCRRKLRSLRNIVTQFDCGRRGKVYRNAFGNRSSFTLSMNLLVYDHVSPRWNHIIHGGNFSSRHRTPGVWINNGHLHVRASSESNWNDGTNCMKVSPRLLKGRRYHIVLVYTPNDVTVYFGHSLNRVCSFQSKIKPSNDAYIGRGSDPGAPVMATIDYIPAALSQKEIKQCYRQLNKTSALLQPAPIEPTFLGCYRDDPRRYLRGSMTSSSRMTPEMCKKHCSSKNFRYFGLQYGSQCFCDNNPSRGFGQKMPDKDCSKPCAGDSRRNCGGTWRNAIYKIN
jgi:hypothetical protein